jgi:hypothetical protein
MKLNLKQWSMIGAALRVAADVYEKDAEAVRVTQGGSRVSAQLDDQATTARDLADSIEGSDLS